MASELAQAIQQVCDDKKIPLASVLETIESALGAAYRKDFGNKLQNIKVDFDMETGAFKVHDIKEVVEDELKAEYERIKEEKIKQAELLLSAAGGASLIGTGEQKIMEMENEAIVGENGEEIKKFNPKTMISLSEAKEIKKKVKLGEELIMELQVPGDFGRMAAQTAKQVIIQKLREAERNTILDEYRDKIGDLLNGTVQRVEGKVVLIDFGNVTAVMPLEEGIRSERYLPGSRFKFYVKNVEEGQRGPKVIVSRTHPDILRKLFKLEVPEIASGAVMIKSIAREAGSRSKVAVMAKDDNIDPIGSCVGQRGSRVQTIIGEVGGEKIDIIEWVEDTAKFIAKALSPAKIIRVVLLGQEGGKTRKQENKKTRKQEEEMREKEGGEMEEKTEKKEEGTEKENKETEEKEEKGSEVSEFALREAKVYVAGDQLSLAIGKEGQNVRLAAKLTGWKIDILEEKLEEDKKEKKDEEKKKEQEEKKQKNKEGEEEKMETEIRNEKSLAASRVRGQAEIRGEEQKKEEKIKEGEDIGN